MKHSIRFLSLLLVFILVFSTALLTSCKKEMPVDEETSTDTDVEEPKTPEVNYIIKTEVKDGCIWVTYSNDPENPVNVGSLGVDGAADSEGSPSYLLLPNGTYGVMAGNAKYLDKIVIAETYNGKPVSTILADAFNGASNLVEISIPSTITSVGDNAFANCDKLKLTEHENACYLGNATNPHLVLVEAKDVTISQCVVKDGTKAICSNAFYNCTNLKSITIPDSVTSIGEKAFYNCSRISSINIPTGNTYIGPETFYECKNLETIKIPATVSTIGAAAFQDCSSLKTVTIEENSLLWGIPNAVFSGCEKLQTINIPKSVTFIGDDKASKSGDGTFYGCKALINVNFEEGSTLREIGRYAFDTCTSLSTLAIPSGVREIGSQAFRNSGIQEIVIPDGVTKIQAKTFNYCKVLKKVTFGKSITTIENKAFEGCTLLNDVALPASLSMIETASFSGCDALTNASFAAPLGWYIIGDEYTSIDDATMSDPLKTAALLTDTNTNKVIAK